MYKFLDILKMKRVLGKLFSYLIWIFFSPYKYGVRPNGKLREVLIVDDLRIGDLITISPVIDCLWKNRINVTLAIREEMKDLFRFNSHIKKIITFNTPLELDEKLADKYDALIDFHPTFKNMFKLLKRKIPIKICLVRGINLGSILTKVFFTNIASPSFIFNEANQVKENLSTLSFLGIRTLKLNYRNYPLRIPLEKEFSKSALRKFELNRRYVILSPGAITLHDQGIQPPSSRKFALIAEHIISTHRYDLVFIGTSDQEKEGKNIISLMRCDKFKVHNLIGQTTLLEMVAIVHASSLVVGLDSGPIHISASQNVKIVDIIPSSKTILWSPWMDNKKYRLLTGNNHSLDNLSINKFNEFVDDLLR